MIFFHSEFHANWPWSHYTCIAFQTIRILNRVMLKMSMVSLQMTMKPKFFLYWGKTGLPFFCMNLSASSFLCLVFIWGTKNYQRIYCLLIVLLLDTVYSFSQLPHANVYSLQIAEVEYFPLQSFSKLWFHISDTLETVPALKLHYVVKAA